ncbi:V-type ATP synthase subunit K [Candidatus Similichlamydia laticola]|uniref:V-type ATP synthase subunit K n=2 Tax=Candidatus Similichlamydia laticola TaxID=2170265 RepID=A0A369KCI0_9BACT|nr:ATP synthase subunit C [Candidatus Similichlamydia laticola]RDB31618.1 V-type ATP synthase subunit K [Candidatus Similichlamydia laticola]
MVGPGLALALGCIGSSLGCQIAAAACLSVMTQTDEGHGKYIAMSAAPASQSIFGFILMLLMKNAILAGSFSPVSGVFLGLGCGLALAISAVAQGKICASGIYMSLKKPENYGKAWAPIGVIESFALFAFVFSLLIMY